MCGVLTFMVVVADVADYKAMWLGRAADKLYTRVEPRRRACHWLPGGASVTLHSSPIVHQYAQYSEKASPKIKTVLPKDLH